MTETYDVVVHAPPTLTPGGEDARSIAVRNGTIAAVESLRSDLTADRVVRLSAEGGHVDWCATGRPSSPRSAHRKGSAMPWGCTRSLVQRSLDRAYYQGWDMHPGDLANRYRATDAFYRSVLSAAATRLTNSLTRQASGVMDEPATGRRWPTGKGEWIYDDPVGCGVPRSPRGHRGR